MILFESAYVAKHAGIAFFSDHALKLNGFRIIGTIKLQRQGNAFCKADRFKAEIAKLPGRADKTVIPAKLAKRRPGHTGDIV